MIFEQRIVLLILFFAASDAKMIRKRRMEDQLPKLYRMINIDKVFSRNYETPICSDVGGIFSTANGEKSCSLLKTDDCLLSKEVEQYCPVTCNACGRVDSRSKFRLFNGMMKSCDWVAKKDTW